LHQSGINMAFRGDDMNDTDYNFAYLDEQTKRMIRRAILKGVAVPGYQVPFASREMPMPYGWGTGGVQVSAACLTPDDTLKVIDQGADDTTNAVSIRKFFEKTAGVAVTERTEEATIIQTRHRIPETPLTEDQILVYQVPIPEPLRFLEPSEVETRKMHALEEYGLMHVKLYEDISRHGEIATAYAYPVSVEGSLRDGPLADPEVRQPQAGKRRAAAFRRGAGAADLRGAAVHEGREPRFRGLPVRSVEGAASLARFAGRRTPISTRSSPTMRAGGCSCVRTPTTARRGGRTRHEAARGIAGNSGPFSAAKIGALPRSTLRSGRGRDVYFERKGGRCWER
jgi:alpha-D-ribose 1-methylphosphonate 5-phosphate C-P lyase